MTEENTIVAVPRQNEITVRKVGEVIEISQPDTSGNDLDAAVFVHENNLASLIVALRRLDGQEV